MADTEEPPRNNVTPLWGAVVMLAFLACLALSVAGLIWLWSPR